MGNTVDDSFVSALTRGRLRKEPAKLAGGAAAGARSTTDAFDGGEAEDFAKDALGGETTSAAVLPPALPLDIAALSGERVGEFRAAGITSTCCTALEGPHHELHHSSTGTDLKHLPSRTHIVHPREPRDL